eukprot:TRINITY_DN17992_c0_g1_i1.p2 TRINITY_DN17992_c0_g1~~TRINITY_DN17992_c0_g1_i1.p2  ORF type:complete len:435 (+),score=101.24 TRINITY_DN17992_c0_g1_i1:1161-2465(+)
MAALEEERIVYKSDSSTNSILVEKGKVDELKLKLAPNLKSGSTGYELMDNSSSFGMTDEEFQIKKKRMIEGELERTIKSFEQIEDARVHITEAQDSVFVTEKQPGKASVALKLKSGQALEKQQVKAIVSLVSMSSKDIPEENISVVDDNLNLLTKDINNKDSIAVDDEAVTKQHQLEKNYEDKLQQEVIKLLEAIVGENKVKATISANLDFDSKQKIQNTVDPNKVIISQESSKEQNNSSTGSVSESPVDNNMTNEIDDNTDNNSSISENQKTNYEIGKSEVKTISAPGEVTRLTASVLIDAKLDEATQQSIQKAVENAIGFDAIRGDEVSVLGIAFDTTQEDQIKEQEDELNQKLEVQKKNRLIIIGAIAGVIVLLVLFLLIRKLRKKKKKEEEELLDTLIDDSLSLIHISEPTRPLYISYAVFCLKKKKKTQ